MARIFIDNPITSQFAMVPNVLWRWPGLSFKAKGFFAYLLSHRDGSCPPVAAMEAETGLGRDARKAAMAELIASGLARWVIQRDGSGRLLAKRLEVTTRPLLAAIAAGVDRAPENPSLGHHATENPAVGHHAPEKPAVGKSVAAATESRRCATENPAILQNRKEKRGARGKPARSGARFASSRGETTRAPADVAPSAAEALAPTPTATSEDREALLARRRELAAELGLPSREPQSGRWVRPAGLAVKRALA